MVIVVKLKNSDTEFHLINFTESNNPNKPYAYLLNVENNGFRRELYGTTSSSSVTSMKRDTDTTRQ